MTFFDLLHAARILRASNWSRRARRLYLSQCLLEPICPTCKAHRINYILMLRRVCEEEHGVRRKKAHNAV